MQRGLGSIVVVLAACTGAPNAQPTPPRPEPHVVASTSTSASTSSSTSSSSGVACTLDSDCPNAATSTEAQVPDLGPVPKPPALDEVEWLKGKTKVTLFVDSAALWAQGAPKACVSLAFERYGAVLGAGVPVKFGENPAANNVWAYALRLGERADLTGPGMHTKTKDGESSTGTGCYRELGHHLQLPLDALRYRGAVVRMGIACDYDDLERDARCPTCVRCARFIERRESLEPSYGIGWASKPTVKTTKGETPACITCPPKDVRRGQLDRFRVLTEDRITIDPNLDGPTFFPTAAACEADRKARLAPKP